MPNRPRAKQSRAARTPGSSAAQPPATGFRRSVERVSYPLLVRLHALPRWLVTGGLAAFLVAGLLAPRPYGPICLGVVVAIMAWLSYLAWPQGDRSRRVVRLVAVGLGVAALLLRVFE
ncbi:DUF6703 family protein [Actinopolymorpha alba]|uniref:DUF6703 family protein n=1 Tax=Actinopolymorpha alba TaxID=533267 RepID=UPI00036EC887|nr:DUF6703 family protein [Actinopolymorpha alba]